MLYYASSPFILASSFSNHIFGGPTSWCPVGYLCGPGYTVSLGQHRYGTTSGECGGGSTESVFLITKNSSRRYDEDQGGPALRGRDPSRGARRDTVYGRSGVGRGNRKGFLAECKARHLSSRVAGHFGVNKVRYGRSECGEPRLLHDVVLEVQRRLLATEPKLV